MNGYTTIIQNYELDNYKDFKIKLLQKRLEKKNKNNLIKQKLAGVFLILMGYITIKYLQDITSTIVLIPVGISLILAKKTYIEF